MILWYWYITLAASLCLTGYLTINMLITAALAAAVHLVPRLAPSKSPLIGALKAAAVSVAAAALIWHESFIPSFSTVFTFLADPATRPSLRYIVDFARQSIDLRMLAVAAAIFAAELYVYRKKPRGLAYFAYAFLAVAWLAQPPGVTAGKGGTSLEAFYRNERGRLVEFTRPDKKSPPFDIIMLHICSLSWADMRSAGFDPVPFLSKFDYVFTNFSVATAYSGPSVLRLLKAPCGQVPQEQLVSTSPANCYLLDDLRGVGYKPYTVFNHDGSYANFNEVVQKMCHGEAPLTSDNIEPVYRMFDGKVLYTDRSELIVYLKARAESNVPRAALYYNTANLHIGTHKMIAEPGYDTTADYGKRLKVMLAEFEDVFSMIERSGRNAMVIFVPEHGAALEATKMQGRDVREIPLPSLAIVPVAVKLIGKKTYAVTEPQVVTKPVSWLGLAWLMSEFLHRNPFAPSALAPEVVASSIPVTEFMAENINASVMREGSGYIYKNKDKAWATLPAYAEIQPGTIPTPGDFEKAARPLNQGPETAAGSNLKGGIVAGAVRPGDRKDQK